MYVNKVLIWILFLLDFFLYIQFKYRKLYLGGGDVSRSKRCVTKNGNNHKGLSWVTLDYGT